MKCLFKSFRTTIACFTLFNATIFLSLQAQPRNRPNIILIMCDDLGWGDIGFNGNQAVHTPNLDALASRGVIFDRFYSASPVCSPTRGSCLTGRNPYRLGIPNANVGHLEPEEVTLAEILKEQGYTTGHFGKWHLGTLTTQIKDANRGRPGDSSHYQLPTFHGFDAYFSTESKVPTYDPMIKPIVFNTTQGENLRYGWAAVNKDQESACYGTFYWDGEEHLVEGDLHGDNSRIIMDRAIPFIKSAHTNDQPFFTVIWFHTPHLPVVADREHRESYSDLSHEKQLYYGAITAMDEQIGRLKQTLDQLGIEDHTWIWFASDNGPERDTPGSAGPFRERKRSLYEGGVRVPAFTVWSSGMMPGRRLKAPVVTSDYLPTIVEALDLPFPKDVTLDGTNVYKILLGRKRKRRSPIGFQYPGKMSWVTDRYKLISTDEGNSFELYDLIEDPSETINIAKLQPKRVKKMKAELLEWVADCNL